MRALIVAELERVQAGEPVSADLRARLREAGWEGDDFGGVDPAGDAAILLAESTLPLAELGRDANLADRVMAALGSAPSQALDLGRDASLADGVMALLGASPTSVGNLGRDASLSDGVMAALGAAPSQVGGLGLNADLVQPVMATLAAPAETVAPVAVPANRSLAWFGLAAAAALVLVGLWPQGAGPSVAADFALSSEVVVEDLAWADSVDVWQDQGEGGALILWVEEREVAL